MFVAARKNEEAELMAFEIGDEYTFTYKQRLFEDGELVSDEKKEETYVCSNEQEAQLIAIGLGCKKVRDAEIICNEPQTYKLIEGVLVFRDE